MRLRGIQGLKKDFHHHIRFIYKCGWHDFHQKSACPAVLLLLNFYTTFEHAYAMKINNAGTKRLSHFFDRFIAKMHQ